MFFVLFFVVVHISKNNKKRIGGGWVYFGQSNFFSDFLFIFTLDNLSFSQIFYFL